MEWRDFLCKSGQLMPGQDYRVNGGIGLTGRKVSMPEGEKNSRKGFFDVKTLEDTAISPENKFKEPDDYYYNILVGGANSGGKGIEGLSYLPFGVISKSKNKVLFRHNQEKEIREAISRALEEGKHPRLFGHSWGGATVARISKDFKTVPSFALDPVSWTGIPEETGKNLQVFFSKNDIKHPNFYTYVGYLAQMLGGRNRWIKKYPKAVFYSGSHVAGVDDVVNAIDRTLRKFH